MIRAIIFDWGRTIFDNDHQKLFSDSLQVLEDLKPKYRLALCSLIGFRKPAETVADREERIRAFGVDQYFESILLKKAVLQTDNKDSVLDETFARLKLAPAEIAVVDDRIIRSVAWANRLGAISIWVKRGKFSNELPNTETGRPTAIISSLVELPRVLERLRDA